MKEKLIKVLKVEPGSLLDREIRETGVAFYEK